MMTKKTALALAAAALLAACGGGSDTPAGVSHAAAADALRARALAAPAAAAVRAEAVTAEQAAEQLMNFAESVAAFKIYFPEHASTATFGPFKYRAYSSGVLLGVVVSADPAYVLNGVYVMGGAFGNNPLYVGKVTDFITPTDPGTGGPTGPNNGCADLSLADTPGTRSVIVYQYSGFITGTQTVDTLVGNATTFEGQQAVETTTKTTGTNTVGGVSVPTETEVKSYLKRTGDAEITHYGSAFTTSSSTTLQGITTTTTTQSKSVYTPPWVDRWYGLAIGASATQSWNDVTTMTTTTSIALPGLPPQTTTNTSTNTAASSMTVKYVSRESVTVPAGTYNTCKFEHTDTTAGETGVTTQWVIVGKGLPVKMTLTTSQGTQTIQATSIKLNGQNL